LPSQIANSVTDAELGIGKKYVPSSVAPVSLRKTCVTCVVATCPSIFTSSVTDSMGSALGSGIPHSTRHRSGTMIPCAGSVAAGARMESSARTKRVRMKVRGEGIVRECVSALLPVV
jgi:hypothetical protein